jgi:hypothetical protein
VKQLGFKVTVLKDASYKAMDSALKRYVTEVRQVLPDGLTATAGTSCSAMGIWTISSPSLPPWDRAAIWPPVRSPASWRGSRPCPSL